MNSIDDLVHETSASTDAGSITVSAVDGRQTFNTAFGTGGSDIFYYFISHRTEGEWEVGTGHLSNATTLERDTVLASSNAGSAVSFSAGVKDVTNDIPAAENYFAGGADVAIADGGTGASTAIEAFNNLKQAASTTATGVIEIATSSEVEAGTANSLAVPPGRQHRHRSAVKAWVKFDSSGNIEASYNVASVDDDGTGNFGVNWDTDFSSADYSVVGSTLLGGLSTRILNIDTQAAGSVDFHVTNHNNNLQDAASYFIVALGDH